MLDLCWYVALTLFGFYAGYIANKRFDTDIENFLQWALPANVAHIFALAVIGDMAVVPLYELLDMNLPSKESALHTPTAVLLTAGCCFGYLTVCSLLPSALSELRGAFRRSKSISKPTGSNVIELPKMPG